MTTTQTDVGTTEISDLDFSLECDVVELHMPTKIPVKCNRPATMKGLTPCCGHPSLACKPHVEDGRRWHCTDCGECFSADDMSWTPL